MNNAIEKSFHKQVTTQVIGGTKFNWVCLCQNTPQKAGFYPCDTKGNEVEPTVKDWTTGWYVCGGCGRIIDQKTRRIVKPL
jgi:hypothetical protein